MLLPIARAPVPSTVSAVNQIKPVPTRTIPAVGTLTPLPVTVPIVSLTQILSDNEITPSLPITSTISEALNEITSSVLGLPSAITNDNRPALSSESIPVSSITSQESSSVSTSRESSTQSKASTTNSIRFTSSTRTINLLAATKSLSAINEDIATTTSLDLSHPFTGTGIFLPTSSSLPGISSNASDSDTAMAVSTGGITALVFLGLFLVGLILIGWGRIKTCFGLRKKQRNLGISNDTIGFDGHGMPRSTSWFLGAGDIKNMTRDARRRTKLRGRGITPSMFLEVPDANNTTGEFDEKETDRLTENKAGVGSFEFTAPVPNKPEQRKRSSYLMQQANYSSPISQQTAFSRPPSPNTPMTNYVQMPSVESPTRSESKQQNDGMPNFPPPSLAKSLSDSSDLIYNMPTNKLMLNEAVQKQIAQDQRAFTDPPVSIMITSSSGKEFSKPVSSIYSSDSLPRLPKLDSSSSIKLESLRNMNMDNNMPTSQQPNEHWSDAAYTAYIPDVPQHSSQRSAAARGLDEELARMDRDFTSYMSRGI